ncbi:hypothetical protein [Billgrantia endophytica]|uniref:hypothetical protein n=1 Tax=Billgrantia endophytica TaxID=2033802 RepID=UPI003BEEBC23
MGREDSQRAVLEAWVQECRGYLGIALTDTITLDAFLHDFNGQLVAKISDSSGKTTCRDEGYVRYLKNAFGVT